ncbi:hypothetical protein GCM10023322_57100 [Rugosimonospora acidiphila]|uniref:Polynucleotide kinase PNKP phosphatase domain-containing protein n=1 Tax=Rugosimonospora acidiphila TaxID=556531 RepID=A0ABP9SDK8_9ACTN
MVDVDGTVALMGKGEPGRRRPFEWHRVGEDDPNQPVIDLVEILRAHYPIVYVSGRDEVCRHATQRWLERHGAIRPGEPLFMRPAGDSRPDDQVKLEIYKRDIEPRYRVVYVLDDRDRVVRAWRSVGLTVLQVAEGNF